MIRGWGVCICVLIAPSPKLWPVSLNERTAVTPGIARRRVVCTASHSRNSSSMLCEDWKPATCASGAIRLWPGQNGPPV